MNGHNGFRSLIYAVRYPVLGFLLGRLAVVVAVLCLPPLAVALIAGESAYVWSILPVIAGLLVCAGLSRRLSEPAALMRNEGFVITCAAFILTPLVMSVALAPCGLPWMDRVFECVSAVTTTGLSTARDLPAMDLTFLFTRAWMQWFGGLGVVVLSVVFLMPRSTAAFQLLEIPEGAGFAASVGAYARRILAVYVALTVLAVLVCWVSFGALFDGLMHAFSAISTGGFSSRDDSLAGLSWAARSGVLLVSAFGAVPLGLYWCLWQGGWRRVLGSQELRVYCGLLLLFGIVLGMLGWSLDGHDPLAAAGHGLLLGISALSTTGFATLDLATTAPVFQLVLILATFIGGCAGSTAGGLKVYRLMVGWQALLMTVRRASAAPHGVIEARLEGGILSTEQLLGAQLTADLMVGLCLLSWLVFLAYGQAPLESLFEVVSAIATTGLSVGVTSAELPLPLKIVLCIDMLAGRVEVVALVCLFYPGLWLGHGSPEK